MTNTANSLSALLDQIGQGQQTINAATNGLTGITSLLQQALSTVQQAQQASQTAGSTTGTVAVTGSTVATAGTLNILVGTTTYGIAIATSETASAIEAAINGTSGLGSAGAVTASDNGSGKIILTANSGGTSFTVLDNATSETLGLTASSTNTAVYGTSSTRTTLQSNYNGLLSQINQLAGDASYNGVNLLNGNNLTIDFNPTGTSSLTITGVNFNASGLGLSSITGSVEFSRTAAHSTPRSRTSMRRSRACRPRPKRSAPMRRHHHPADVRNESDQYAANRRQQPRGGGPEPGKRQPPDRADPAAAGNLGTVDRQPGEPVGAQAVRLKLFWYRPT